MFYCIEEERGVIRVVCYIVMSEIKINCVGGLN